VTVLFHTHISYPTLIDQGWTYS